MEILLTMTYVAICFAVFKIFRIPVNQWSLATAALGGILGLSLLFITMAYNHPYSTNARIYFAVTPIVPNVKGRVIEVPVMANTPLQKGDVLFRIDPTPYQYIVDQRKAALAEAEPEEDATDSQSQGEQDFRFLPPDSSGIGSRRQVKIESIALVAARGLVAAPSPADAGQPPWSPLTIAKLISTCSLRPLLCRARASVEWS